LNIGLEKNCHPARMSSLSFISTRSRRVNNGANGGQAQPDLTSIRTQSVNAGPLLEIFDQLILIQMRRRNLVTFTRVDLVHGHLCADRDKTPRSTEVGAENEGDSDGPRQKTLPGATGAGVAPSACRAWPCVAGPTPWTPPPVPDTPFLPSRRAYPLWAAEDRHPRWRLHPRHRQPSFADNQDSSCDNLV
jgi:hypothetical protein